MLSMAPATAQTPQVPATFRLDEATLRASLDSLMRWFPVSIVYLDRDVEGILVSASCNQCGFEEALNRILDGTPLRWMRFGNQVILRMSPSEAPRQETTLCGTVTDSTTGDAIAGANVVLQDNAAGPSVPGSRWCPSNAFGFYSLRNIPPGSHTLLVRAVGYKPRTMTISVAGAPVRSDIFLVQEEITMQEVTVEGRRSSLASATAYSRGIYIPAAPGDQNQYILDGARIYNPAHFGGVLTTFNPEGLSDIRVASGGTPPQYGGRIGGILDLSMRDGSRQHLAGSAGTGSLGSSLSLEGPLGDRTTFLASARRGYPHPFVPYVESQGPPGNLGSTEVVAKVSHQLSGSSRLFLSGYYGRDSYANHVPGDRQELSNDFSWGNKAVSLRWMAIGSPSTFLHGSLVYTRYDFALDEMLTGPLALPVAGPLSSGYAVEDFDISAEAEQYYDEDHTVRAGAELVHHRLDGSITGFATQTAGLSLNGYTIWELTVYLQDQWRLLPHLLAEVGGRATTTSGANGTFSGVDPRFALTYYTENGSKIYGALTSVNQFLHPYRNSGLFLFYPTIFWYPSTDRVRPVTSIQGTLGGELSFDDRSSELAAECFYRLTRNLHEFGVDTTTAGSRDLSDMVMTGTGKSYGVELSYRKRSGDFSGSLSYTLSWETQTFPELNGGQPFVPRLARRHEARLGAWYTPGEHWALGVICVVASDQSPSFSPRVLNRNYNVGVSANTLIDVNGSRLPGFQRLEINVAHRFSLWGLSTQLSLRMLNAYGLVDPIDWKLLTSEDIRLKWDATLRDIKLFPLYPTLGLTVRF